MASNDSDGNDDRSTGEKVREGLETARSAVETGRNVAQGVRDLSQGRNPISSVGKLSDAAGSVANRMGGGDSVFANITDTISQGARTFEEMRGLVEDVSGAVESARRAASGEPLPKVQYHFESKGDEHTVWRVYKVHVVSMLADLYVATLELANEDLSADPDKLLDEDCTFTMKREPMEHPMRGIVHRVEHMGTRAGHLCCRVRIVPALYALDQRTNSRIFQDMTVGEIVSKVLDEGLAPYQREFELQLQREYPKREYCVQYRETDLQFVRRMLDEEGIVFSFVHTDEREKLLLVDNNEAYQPIETLDTDELVIAGPEGETMSVETVRFFDWRNEIQPTSAVLRDFDWTSPTMDLTRESRAKDARNHDREFFDYPARFTITKYDSGQKKYTQENGTMRARIRREEFKSWEERGTGQSNAIGLLPGRTFKLHGHGRSDLDREYLLTHVEHVGEAPEQLTNDTHASDEHSSVRYVNTFECITRSQPYRPTVPVERPIVHGLQTATVVGPKPSDGGVQDDIHTDEHGRIRVQFHWDREGKFNETSSCWIRVAQKWAGAGWGFVFIPRVGMEALVEFLEGDPDRPIVTGCVYNGINTLPYPLPDNKTKSTIRTQSSPGNDPAKYNEIRFEDASGSEEIFSHAQKDYNEVIEHNHTTTVHNDQTNTVDANQTQSIGANQTESVGGNQSMTVTKDRTKAIKQKETITVDHGREGTIGDFDKLKVTGPSTTEINGLTTIKIHNTRDTTIDTNEMVKIGGLRNTQVTGTDDLSVTGVQTVKLLASASLSVTGKYEVTANKSTLVFDGGNVTLTGKANVTVTNASGNVSVSAPTGSLSISAANEVSITCGKASISLKSDGTVAISGAKEVGIGSGSTAVKLEPAGLSNSGPKINSSAIGIHEIAGALIKIN